MTRICSKCQTRKATNSFGIARCDQCRTHRTQTYRECACGRQFKTTGSNTVCVPCRHQAAKHPCADCGEPCDKRAERCLACHSAAQPTGEANPNWKGGKVRSHKTRGYVRLKAPGHPRATNGYVSEHVLVMEEMLGRYLLPGENVHHRNGIKDDNRPENLELWLVAQPAGQRVEDMVEWAKEILDRYTPERVTVTVERSTA